MRKAKGRITGGDELVNMKYIAQIKIIYSMNKNLLIISTKAKHFDLVCLLSERKQNVYVKCCLHNKKSANQKILAMGKGEGGYLTKIVQDMTFEKFNNTPAKPGVELYLE